LSADKKKGGGQLSLGLAPFLTTRQRNANMTKVYVLNNNMDQAIKILQRKNQKAGILKDLQMRKGALSKSERRRFKDYTAALRLAKMQRHR